MTERPADSRFAPAAVVLGCFLAGLGIMQAYLNRDAIATLTRDAYLARFQAMVPASSARLRYYVLHEPGTALDARAAADRGVAKVTATRFEGLSTVDLAPGNDAAIDVIRNLEGVRWAIRSDIPLFCH